MVKATKVTVTPLPEKPEGFGLSDKGPGKAPQIRHSRPDVAKHWARMIISCNMDYEAAVAKGLASEYPDATEAQIVSLARTLEKSPYINREKSNILEEIGMGDNALKRYAALLWAEAHGTNDKRWSPAMRLIGEMVGASKAAARDEKIPALKLAGMKEGLSQMLGAAAPTDDTDISVEQPFDTLEEDDTDAGNI
jgi:hypothetical protein